MRGAIFIFVLVLSFSKVNAQGFEKERAEIDSIISQFSQCISNKDSVSFLRLFTPNSFQWIGVVKNKTNQVVQEHVKSKTNNYFFNDYAVFYKFLGDKGKQEEIFENIIVTNDDVIGSVSFDYQYWNNGKITNWGKEYWTLVKMNGTWKIVNVVFSIAE
ncbi:hypothetical protein [Siphonobacter curvatus]|uniref:Nuclear transport factor 2 family protein n=1 Tax=Siphonobacter curvatus TaxID=2094562 RepID=A0A2S7IRW9_9BACT|nr:hypothetical protein [Siphonobacter curvatus]PQA60419.1 hypothetical protein C5O19_12610 [Siphonobacter curvatus]